MKDGKDELLIYSVIPYCFIKTTMLEQITYTILSYYYDTCKKAINMLVWPYASFIRVVQLQGEKIF